MRFVVLAIAIACFAFAWLTSMADQGLDGGNTVTGTVVALEPGSGTSNGQQAEHPIVEYDVNGQTFQATSEIGFYGQFSIGDPLEVSYVPSQPNEAKVLHEGARLMSLPFFVSGCVCLGIAARKNL